MKRLLPLILLSACQPALDDGVPKLDTASKQTSLLRLADATAAAGDVDATIELYEQAIAADPDAVAPRLKLARAYLAKPAPEQAVTVLKQAQSTDPDDAELLLLLGQAHIAENKPSKALPPLERAMALPDADTSRLTTYKAVALDMLGQYPAAQDAYKTALAGATPEEAPAIRNNLAMSHILQGDYAQAISILQQLMTEGNDQPTIRQNLAMAYGLSGEETKAMQLGLQDLDEKEAQENVDFLRQYRTLKQ